MNACHGLPEKIKVARSFGDAASHYDQYAHMQRDIADKLFSGLDSGNAISPRTILDLGSGTGYCASNLSTIYSEASITSLDISEGMLNYTRQNSVVSSTGIGSKENWACGDAEKLPFRDDIFDLVISNLAMQWCMNPENVFSEVFRIMKPGAHAWLSTLAEHTLKELRESWASIDSYVHVNSFYSCERIIEKLNAVSFTQKNVTNTPEIYFYNSLSELTGELKGIGAHNLNAGQAGGLTGKSKLKKLKGSFEKNRVPEKGIPVTYDLVLLHLVK